MTNEATATKQKIDPKLLEMEARAKTAQAQAREQRKQAPDGLLIGAKHSIEQKVLIEKYAKKLGQKGQDAEGGMHLTFLDRDLTDQYPDQGYQPVIDTSAGGVRKQVVSRGGDPMWMIPTDIYKGQLRDTAARANKLAQQQVQAKIGTTPTAPGETLQTAKIGTPEAVALARQEVGL